MSKWESVWSKVLYNAGDREESVGWSSSCCAGAYLADTLVRLSFFTSFLAASSLSRSSWRHRIPRQPSCIGENDSVGVRLIDIDSHCTSSLMRTRVLLIQFVRLLVCYVNMCSRLFKVTAAILLVSLTWTTVAHAAAGVFDVYFHSYFHCGLTSNLRQDVSHGQFSRFVITFLFGSCELVAYVNKGL